jgi:hypothetical protein
MKTYKEFIAEGKKISDEFKKALKDYQKKQKAKAKTDVVLAKDTPPKSKKRKEVVGQLLKVQGGGPVTSNLKTVQKLQRAARKAAKKGKSPEKIRAKIDTATHQPARGSYKPSQNYNPNNVPKPGSVTAHDGSAQKVNWKY